MAKYAINTTLGGTVQSVTSTYKTLLTAVNSATVRRIKLYDINFGTNGTPADNFMEWDVSRQTAAGTINSVTPNPLDPADAAALTAAGANATAEGTVTANSSLYYLPENQRASWRWVASPGSELVAPATNAAGFAMRVRSGGYTGTAGWTALFEEQ